MIHLKEIDESLRVIDQKTDDADGDMNPMCLPSFRRGGGGLSKSTARMLKSHRVGGNRKR